MPTLPSYTPQNGGYGFTGLQTAQSSGSTQSSSSQSSSSNPVQTAQSELSLLISQLAQKYAGQTMDFAQNQIPSNNALTDSVVGNYMDSSRLALSGARTADADYNNIYRPEMANLANLAGTYSSGARQQFAAGQAAATSVAGTQAGIDSTMSQLEGYGVNPSAGSFGSLLAAQKVGQGAAAAAAGTGAAANTAAAGRQLLQTSVGVGEQLPGVEANFLNSGAAGLSGAESAKLGNTTTGSTALTAPSQYLANAQNMVGPATSSSSSGSSQSTGSNQSSQTAFTPQNGPHYIASGGAIPDDNNTDAMDPSNQTQGGHIPASMSPSHGAITDDVNAHVNTDEFVIPKDVALWVGQKQLQTMIGKSRAEMQAPGLARPDASGASPAQHGQAQFVSQSAGAGTPQHARGGRVRTDSWAAGGAIPA